MMGDFQNSGTDAGVAKSEYIKLKVIGQDLYEVHFRVKRNAEFLRLMTTYSEKMGAPLSSLKFLFDGVRVQKDDTPVKLEMEDDDSIEVHQEQTGGDGCSCCGTISNVIN